MSNNVQLQSPLAHSTWLPFPAEGVADAPIRMVEVPFLPMFTLRGDPCDEGFRTTTEAALGLALPTTPNTVAGNDTHLVAWMGPDEWLIQSRRAQAATAPLTRLAEQLVGRFALIVDVSSGYTVIELRGPRAADVLAKGCALDLHPKVFGSGQCAQTRFFDAAVLLRRTDDGISMTARRSYAPYVAELLVDAAREFV